MRHALSSLTLESLSEELLAPEVEGDAKGYLYLVRMDECCAREFFENARWPRGPACVRCRSKSVDRAHGSFAFPGLYECGKCHGRFTVRTDTVLEEMKSPFQKCLRGIFLLCCSGRQISSAELGRILAVEYEPARTIVRLVGSVLGFDQAGRCDATSANVERAVSMLLKR